MESKFLLGTYTRKSSQGVYSAVLDEDAGQIKELTLVLKEVSPTYLTTAKSGVLYTVGADENGGGISAYEKTPQGYQFLNAVTKDGSAPCYVAVDEARQLVYSANYHQGTLRTYQIQTDGTLQLATEVHHTHPTGPNPNQNVQHVHYTDLTPDSRLVACDLGTDEVYTYDVAADGQLTPVAIYQTAAGAGPRHLVFHPTLAVAYLINELNSTVSVLKYFPDGHFEQQQTLGTLPENFTGENSGGAIRIAKDGRTLYASNRGHNSIAIYDVAPDGLTLTLEEIISTHGDFPRDFALSPSGEFLICAHQKSDQLSLFKIQANGSLHFLNNDTWAPEAVCVYFEK